MDKYLKQSITFLLIGSLVFIFSRQINAAILHFFINDGFVAILTGLLTFFVIILIAINLIIIGLVKLHKYFKTKKEANQQIIK